MSFLVQQTCGAHGRQLGTKGETECTVRNRGTTIGSLCKELPIEWKVGMRTEREDIKGLLNGTD